MTSDRVEIVLKHAAPIHPGTGSDQSVHSGDGGSIARPLGEVEKTDMYTNELQVFSGKQRAYDVDGVTVWIRRSEGEPEIEQRHIDLIESIPDEMWKRSRNPEVMFTDTRFMTVTVAPSMSNNQNFADGLYWAGEEVTDTRGWGEALDRNNFIWVRDSVQIDKVQRNLIHEIGHSVWFHDVVGAEDHKKIRISFEQLVSANPAGEVAGFDLWDYPRSAYQTGSEAFAEAHSYMAFSELDNMVKSDADRAQADADKYEGLDTYHVWDWWNEFYGDDVPQVSKELVDSGVSKFYGTCGVDSLFRDIEKHYGPGPHPGTGTDQSIHGGNTPQANVLSYLSVLERLKEMNGYEGETSGSLLSKHGRFFTPPRDIDHNLALLEEHGLDPGGLKQCYANAGGCVLFNDTDLTYVEGLADMGIMPVEHAWLVTKDGQVIDPTWGQYQASTMVDGEQWGEPHDSTPGLAYYGIPFTTEALRESTLSNEMWGMLGYWNSALFDDFPEDIISKHYGPGQHPSGSAQDVHGQRVRMQRFPGINWKEHGVEHPELPDRPPWSDWTPVLSPDKAEEYFANHGLEHVVFGAHATADIEGIIEDGFLSIYQSPINGWGDGVYMVHEDADDYHESASEYATHTGTSVRLAMGFKNPLTVYARDPSEATFDAMWETDAMFARFRYVGEGEWPLDVHDIITAAGIEWDESWEQPTSKMMDLTEKFRRKGDNFPGIEKLLMDAGYDGLIIEAPHVFPKEFFREYTPSERDLTGEGERFPTKPEYNELWTGDYLNEERYPAPGTAGSQTVAFDPGHVAIVGMTDYTTSNSGLSWSNPTDSRVLDALDAVSKHGNKHDEKSHGNWAKGKTYVEERAGNLNKWVSHQAGVSTKDVFELDRELWDDSVDEESVRAYSLAGPDFNIWYMGGDIPHIGDYTDEQVVEMDRKLVEMTESPLSSDDGDLKLFRGFDGEDIGMTKENWESFIGKTVGVEGFMSTSINPRVATRFALDNVPDHVPLVVMEIDTKRNAPGAYIEGYTSHAGENEVLLPLGTRVRIQEIVYLKKAGYLPNPIMYVMGVRE